MVAGKEILISFSSGDNQPPIAGDRGWVASFCKFITTLLTQIMKEEPVIRMIDESQQKLDEIDKAAIFIAIISNNFTSDNSLLAGISHFGRKAMENESLILSGKSRMFRETKSSYRRDR